MSHKTEVIVTFPDGSEKEYPSISETAIAVGLRRLTVQRHLRGDFSRNNMGLKFRVSNDKFRRSIEDDDD